VRVEIDIEVDDRGAPSCRGLRIVPYEDGPPVTGTLLRDVAIDRLMRRAVTRDTFRLEPQDPGLARAVRFDARSFLEHYRHGARQPRRGAPVTAADLSNIADMYRTEFETGSTSPTKAIAETFRVDRSTARRWVQRARKEGLLGQPRQGEQAHSNHRN
jgi:hypothetical protein